MKKHIFLRSVALLALTALGACQGKPEAPAQSPLVKLGKPYTVQGTTYYPKYDPTYDTVGEASWYGPGFHGKYTACGEIFNQDDTTAAHPTLPMPSLVRVTNLANGNSLVVRINDRGPFKKGRIIDLSRKSAQLLGIKGVSQVRVQYLKEETDLHIANLGGGKPGQTQLAMTGPAGSSGGGGLEGSQAVETLINASPGGPVSLAAPVMSVQARDLTPAPGDFPVSRVGRPAPQMVVREDYREPRLVQAAYTENGASEGRRGDKAVAQEPAVEQNAAKPRVIKIAPREPSENGVRVLRVQPQIDTGSEAQAGQELEDPLLLPPQMKPVSASKPNTKVVEPTLQPSSAIAKPSAAASGEGRYYVQAGSFASQENAGKLARSLEALGKVQTFTTRSGGRTWYRVRVGGVATPAEAEALRSRVQTVSGIADGRVVKE